MDRSRLHQQLCAICGAGGCKRPGIFLSAPLRSKRSDLRGLGSGSKLPVSDSKAFQRQAKSIIWTSERLLTAPVFNFGCGSNADAPA